MAATKTKTPSASTQAKIRAANRRKATPAKGKAKPRSAQKRSATTQVRANAKFGGQRNNVRRKVVSLRDKKQKSWGDIGTELGVAPRTARRLYDEVKGNGAHHGLLKGKGGRQPVA